MDTIVRQLSLALVFIASIAHCEPALNTEYGVPGNFPGSNGNNHGSQHGGNGFDGHSYDNGHSSQDYVDDQPKSYEFGYAVKDQATGNDFGRQETSDGETVRGEYRVQLPDGRTQIVTYTADWRTGFHAEVRYEGTATYPDQYNAQNNEYNNNNGAQGFGYQRNNFAGGFNAGNNGGYNNHQHNSGNYNSGSNYQAGYQVGSNHVNNGYNNFGARTGYNAANPSPTYGPSFH